MKELMTLDGSTPHPAVDDLCTQVRSGEINRRQFLRTAALLGITAASASSFIGSALFSDSALAAETPRPGGTLLRLYGVALHCLARDAVERGDRIRAHAHGRRAKTLHDGGVHDERRFVRGHRHA